MQKTIIASFLLDELDRANNIYGERFSSPHEGYVVMLEELDELFEEIRQKRPDKERLREQAIQIGAMAIKFILSLEKVTSIDKCRQCLFAVMTSNELAELGDPCENCDRNLSNWQLRDTHICRQKAKSEPKKSILRRFGERE